MTEKKKIKYTEPAEYFPKNMRKPAYGKAATKAKKPTAKKKAK